MPTQQVWRQKWSCNQNTAEVYGMRVIAGRGYQQIAGMSAGAARNSACATSGST
jgi:hypothetical protein